MTYLGFVLDPQHGATIVTDTLVTDLAGVDVARSTKCYLFPHADMVVVVTGMADLAKVWNHTLHAYDGPRDLLEADAMAPTLLPTLHDQIVHSTPERTSTAYHFGLDRTVGQVVGYAYRSTNGFASERLDQACSAAKPHPAAGGDRLAGLTLDDPHALVTLGREIRAEQNRRPPDERVHIGGDAVMTRLVIEDFGFVIATAKIGTFDDGDGAA